MTPEHQRGFTLLEMMVALAIFAVISLAGYQMLQGMLRNNQQLQQHIASLSDVERLLALLDRDLSQAMIPAHPAAVPAGEPAFTASNSGTEILRLSRRNWLNPLQQNRSSLQRVAWRFSDSTLTRFDLSSGEAGTPFRDIQAVRLRFWQGNHWQENWPSQQLPLAVEVTLNVSPWGEIRSLILLAGAPQ